MPWSVRKAGNKWAIVKSDTGEVVGHSVNRAKAMASVKARYANYNVAKEMPKACPTCGREM